MRDVAAAVGLLASLSAATPASAQPRGTAPTPVETPRVHVVLPADLPPQTRARLAGSIRAHALELDVALEVVDAPAGFTPVLLLSELRIDAVWLVDGDQGWELYAVQRGARAVWRRGSSVEGLDATSIETLAAITTGLGLALQDGDVRGMDRVDPSTLEPEPEPEPEPKPEPEPEPEPEPAREPEPITPADRRPPVWLGVQYQGNTFADALPWQHGLGLGVAWRIRPRLALGLRYALVFTRTVSVAGVVFDIRRHPISAAASVHIPVGDRLDVRGGGAWTLDPLTRVVTGGAPVDGERRSRRWFSHLSAEAGVGVYVVPQVRLGVDVALDVLLTRADTVVVVGETTVRVTPARARVRAGLGVEVGLGKK
ncbi:MAG: hypothetical protein AAGA54_28900 [Myxococcota bacterium]